MMTETNPETLIDTKAAAPLLGLRPGTLAIWRSQRRRDQPPYIRCGRNVRYRAAAIAEWVKRHEHDPAARGKA